MIVRLWGNRSGLWEPAGCSLNPEVSQAPYNPSYKKLGPRSREDIRGLVPFC